MTKQETMKPCVRCLSKKIKKILAGPGNALKIFQCHECGFNVTAVSFDLAEKKWNGFKVWDLIPKS